MTRNIILSIALAVLCTANVCAKKDKKKAQEQANKPVAVTLLNGNDSLSYAAGYQQVNGLVDFLLQQGIDTAYMADFIIGMKEAVDKAESPSFIARSMGYNIASQLRERMLPGLANELKGSPDSLIAEKFYQGFFASLENDTTHFKLEEAQNFFQNRLIQDQEVKKIMQSKAGVDFLAANAKKEGVITTPSGLQYKIITAGTGAIPQKNQTVAVKYEGKLIDGTIFDSSYKRKDPITKFRCDQVIKGWTEALTMMPVGSTWELYIPQELAYGEHQQGQIPPYSCLIFKVELIDIEGMEPAKVEETVEPAKAIKVSGSSKATPKKKK